MNFPELLKLKDKVLEMFESEAQHIVSVRGAENRSDWDIKGMTESIHKITPVNGELEGKLKDIINSNKPDEEARSLATDLVFDVLSTSSVLLNTSNFDNAFVSKGLSLNPNRAQMF